MMNDIYNYYLLVINNIHFLYFYIFFRLFNYIYLLKELVLAPFIPSNVGMY